MSEQNPQSPSSPSAKTVISDTSRRSQVVITRADKESLAIHTPVMNAAGILGFGMAYRDEIKLDKLGAIVTAPITYEPRQPARGARVVPLDAGVLIHTGLPNPGLRKALELYQPAWALLPAPVILHLVATDTRDIRRSIEILNEADGVDAVELGLLDDMDWEQVARLVKAAVNHSEKPIIVRLAMETAYETAQSAADAGAHALVVAGPPRGVARDPHSAHLVGGRVYSPVLKPIILQMVGKLRRLVPHVPIIGAGGIHSQQDARDYIQAGAVAVQVDTVTWVKPRVLEYIARDLGGMVVTRDTGAFADEWHEGMGETEQTARQKPLRQGKTPPDEQPRR